MKVIVRRERSREIGATLVQVAIVLPLVLFLMLGLFDLARFSWIRSAVRSGLIEGIKEAERTPEIVCSGWGSDFTPNQLDALKAARQKIVQTAMESISAFTSSSVEFSDVLHYTPYYDPVDGVQKIDAWPSEALKMGVLLPGTSVEVIDFDRQPFSHTQYCVRVDSADIVSGPGVPPDYWLSFHGFSHCEHSLPLNDDSLTDLLQLYPVELNAYVTIPTFFLGDIEVPIQAAGYVRNSQVRCLCPDEGCPPYSQMMPNEPPTEWDDYVFSDPDESCLDVTCYHPYCRCNCPEARVCPEYSHETGVMLPMDYPPEYTDCEQDLECFEPECECNCLPLEACPPGSHQDGFRTVDSPSYDDCITKTDCQETLCRCDCPAPETCPAGSHPDGQIEFTVGPLDYCEEETCYRPRCECDCPTLTCGPGLVETGRRTYTYSSGGCEDNPDCTEPICEPPCDCPAIDPCPGGWVFLGMENYTFDGPSCAPVTCQRRRCEPYCSCPSLSCPSGEVQVDTETYTMDGPSCYPRSCTRPVCEPYCSCPSLSCPSGQVQIGTESYTKDGPGCYPRTCTRPICEPYCSCPSLSCPSGEVQTGTETYTYDAAGCHPRSCSRPTCEPYCTCPDLSSCPGGYRRTGWESYTYDQSWCHPRTCSRAVCKRCRYSFHFQMGLPQLWAPPVGEYDRVESLPDGWAQIKEEGAEIPNCPNIFEQVMEANWYWGSSSGWYYYNSSCQFVNGSDSSYTWCGNGQITFYQNAWLFILLIAFFALWAMFPGLGFSPVSLNWDPNLDAAGMHPDEFLVQKAPSHIADVVHYNEFPINPDKPDTWTLWRGSIHTPLLVFDPNHSGKIESASQLFGNFTFGKRWLHGYEALATLDADQDGSVNGSELKDLALWFDYNGDGVSQPGEVKSLEELKVTRLGYKPDRIDQDAPSVIVDEGYSRMVEGSEVTGSSVDWFTFSFDERVKEDHFKDRQYRKPSETLGKQLEKAPLLPKDATTELTGLWEWQYDKAIDTPAGDITPSGHLRFIDIKDDVYGISFMVKEIIDEGVGPNGKEVVKAPLSGKKEVGSDGEISVQFDVAAPKDQTVHSNAILSADGMTLRGESTVEAAKDPDTGDIFTVHYTWTAKRVVASK